MHKERTEPFTELYTFYIVLNEIKQVHKKQKTLKIIRLTVFCCDLLLGSSG